VKVKYAEREGYSFCYLSRGEPGTQPSVLMLHGFSFNKDMWLNTIKHFPRGIHLVCLDMPGHGETTRLLAETYTAADQAKMIHQFVERTGLSRKPFHLVGISTGGMVAGVYAALYPSDVCALSLLCPPGLLYPPENEFIKYLRKLRDSANSHENPFVLLSLCSGKMMTETTLTFSFIGKGFLDLSSMTSRYSLRDNMNKIRAPIQVIWGKDDKVMDPSGAALLAKAIPSTQVQLLDKCGHFITLDRPKKSAKLLLEFYKSNCATAKPKKLS
uniref:acylglycerol lipase n=1 Tax=Varanus komodoensis TaxID=61221 RepID=A0A8D2LHG3_VARKO